MSYSQSAPAMAAVAIAAAMGAHYGNVGQIVQQTFGTHGQVELVANAKRKSYILSASAFSLRYVTAIEDQVLRAAVLRAGKLISKGRLAIK